MDRASAELAKIAPAKVANSDAKALARYLTALMIEAGGGLSLAVGMALSGPVRVPSALPADLPGPLGPFGHPSRPWWSAPGHRPADATRTARPR